MQPLSGSLCTVQPLSGSLCTGHGQHITSRNRPVKETNQYNHTTHLVNRTYRELHPCQMNDRLAVSYPRDRRRLHSHSLNPGHYLSVQHLIYADLVAQRTTPDQHCSNRSCGSRSQNIVVACKLQHKNHREATPSSCNTGLTKIPIELTQSIYSSQR